MSTYVNVLKQLKDAKEKVAEQSETIDGLADALVYQRQCIRRFVIGVIDNLETLASDLMLS